MITPFGEFLGCSTQAAAQRSIGPSPGYLTDLELSDLLDRTAESDFYNYYFGSRGTGEAEKNLGRIGVTRCPVVQESRGIYSKDIETSGVEQSCQENIRLNRKI